MIYYFWGLFLKKSIDFRERQKGRERDVSQLLYVQLLILTCALPGDQIHSLCLSEWRSNQLSYPARAASEVLFLKNNHTEVIQINGLIL